MRRGGLIVNEIKDCLSVSKSIYISALTAAPTSNNITEREFRIQKAAAALPTNNHHPSWKKWF